MDEKSPVTRAEFSEFVDFVKEKVVTKNDLKGFATKKDLEMFATREALQKLDEKGDKRHRDIMTTLDAILKIVSDRNEEDAAHKMQTTRHDRWIKELAGAVGHELSQ